MNDESGGGRGELIKEIKLERERERKRNLWIKRMCYNLSCNNKWFMLQPQWL